MKPTMLPIPSCQNSGSLTPSSHACMCWVAGIEGLSKGWIPIQAPWFTSSVSIEMFHSSQGLSLLTCKMEDNNNCYTLELKGFSEVIHAERFPPHLTHKKCSINCHNYDYRLLSEKPPKIPRLWNSLPTTFRASFGARWPHCLQTRLAGWEDFSPHLTQDLCCVCLVASVMSKHRIY